VKPGQQFAAEYSSPVKRHRFPNASKAGRRIAGLGEASRSEIIDSR
jgi:hypothetical protein